MYDSFYSMRIAILSKKKVNTLVCLKLCIYCFSLPIFLLKLHYCTQIITDLSFNRLPILTPVEKEK